MADGNPTEPKPSLHYSKTPISHQRSTLHALRLTFLRSPAQSGSIRLLLTHFVPARRPNAAAEKNLCVAPVGMF